MASLINFRHIGRDATQNVRVPIADGIVILPNTFVQNVNDAISVATASSTALGFALTGGVGSTTDKCSVVYIVVADGDEFIIKSSTPTVALVTGYYTLLDADTIDASTFSATPIQGKMNFLWNGRTFVAHTY